ncbi:MAG: PHP domain-containing protein, partial [Pseudomonadota bacterium]
MSKPIRAADIDDGVGRAAAARFVHLKVHSAYSLLEGALPIAKLAKLAAGHGFSAIGLSDTGNLFGILEFSEKLSAAGIQPIAGLSLSIDFGDTSEQLSARAMPVSKSGDGAIALFAMSEAGYANLMKLASQAFFDPSETDLPHVGIERLKAHHEGLIALTGGPAGPIDRAFTDSQSDRATGRLQTLHALFGDRLYIELQRHGLADEKRVEPLLVKEAYARGIPLVATNEVFFATPADHKAHDALLCIADGRYVVEEDRRRITPDHHLKSAEDMAALFADLPEAIETTFEIAQRCAFRPLGKDPILPRFVSAGDGASEQDQLKAEVAELQRQAREGLG